MSPAIDLQASVGRPGFIAGHQLWTPEQHEAAARVIATVEEQGLRAVRVNMIDPHGKQRGKTVLAGAFPGVLRNGLDFATAAYHFDTADGIVYNPFEAGGGLGMGHMTGFPDAVLVPDPLTFQVLPWAPGTGWMLGSMYFGDGTPVPFDPRGVLSRSLAELDRVGYGFLAGLEVEFYLTKVTSSTRHAELLGGPGAPPAPPVVEAIGDGYCYQSDDHLDQIHDVLAHLADAILAVGLPLRTMEDEWGPGQCELTFGPLDGAAAADAMTLFRSAVKQISRRLGLHATFMCRPALPSFYASGWHLHQSLTGPDGTNVFATPADSGLLLSDVATSFVGGLLEHAAASSVFTTPTVNGYRRRKPFSLAPDRATWGDDNRAAMIRVQGGPGDPTAHIENRIGEPAANPYLYLASQIVTGLDGLHRQLDPGPLEAEPYSATDRPLLPTTLIEAVAALKTSTVFREAWGGAFVDWLVGIKEFEYARFLTAEPYWQSEPDKVTEWEHLEYFAQY